MIVKLTILTDKGFERKEYKAKAVKFSADCLALDLGGRTWRRVEIDIRKTTIDIIEE